MRKIHWNFFLMVLFDVIAQRLFSQNNIVIENTVINNTATFYGAMNSVTSPGTPTKPISIFTGDKKVEFVTKGEIHLLPGFHATAQPGGSFKAYIDPNFSVTTDPFALETNEFRIGMFGYEFTSIYNDIGYWPILTPPAPVGYDVPYNVGIPTGLNGTYLFNGTTPGKSSQLNVLKEDGFNTVFTYGWLGGFLGDNAVYPPMIELAKNNGLQLMADVKNYWKPDVTGFNGSVVFDGRGNLPANTTGRVARPDYDNLIDNIFTSQNYKSTIWGYQMSEEFSHAQPGNVNDTQDWCWKSCDETRVRHIDCPASSAANAIGHFRNKLNTQGVLNQKLVIMDSFHFGSIRDNSIGSNYTDGTYQCANCNPMPTSETINEELVPSGILQGISQPQDYINPALMGNNMPDVFFEGSYWYTGLDEGTWANNPYNNVYNSINTKGDPAYPVPLVQNHYLGEFKSIDYAYSKGIKEVHKVIDVSGIHLDQSIKNANGLWFQAYTSIIHGVKGIWFYLMTTENGGNYSSSGTDPIRKANLVDPFNPQRFNRENFPEVYDYYARYLSKELAYLSGKNLISTDPKTILYSKTDNADPNCIVPASSTYIDNALHDNFFEQLPFPHLPQKYKDVRDDGEAYGLRYTIRTNGDEVIMIISNPLGIAVKDVILSFDQLTNTKIKASGGVDVLWGDPFHPDHPVDDPQYRINRSNGINLNTLTLGGSDADYFPFLPNKQLQISFGPLDVKILRFVDQPGALANTNNGWEQVWTNEGNNAISTWLLRPNDHIVIGDFNGDTDDELLCTQEASHYASLLDFYDGTWNTTWSNLGNNILGENWLIHNTDILVSGNFDGDSKDELLGLQQGNGNDGYANLFSYINNNFERVWHNGYNTLIGTWPISNSDKILAGDFDGDNKDELLCIQDANGSAKMLKYVSGNWQELWFNPVSGSIDNWQLTSNRKYSVADFNNDGIDEILCLDMSATPPTAEILHYDPNATDPILDPKWYYSNFDLNGLFNWQNDLYLSPSQQCLPYSGTVLSGNIDYDGKEELMYVAANGNSKSAEYADATLFSENWNNSADAPYIDDWNAMMTFCVSLDNYMLVKAEKYMPEYLLAFRGHITDCSVSDLIYLVSMYRSQDLTNKREASPQPETTTNNSDDYINIFPNPTSGMFTLITGIGLKHNEDDTVERKTKDENETYDVYVYNSIGKEVYSKQNTPSSITQLPINLASQSKGVYLVRTVKNTGKSKTSKVVIN